MPKGWRYFAQRLDGTGVDAELIDLDLPLQKVSMTDVLSGPTRFNATMEPEVSRLVGPDGMPLLLKWRTAIYAEREGEIRAGAILTEPGWDGHVFNLQMLGFAGYPNGQTYTESWSGVQVDPLDVVREAWRHLQAQPKGNIGMRVDTTTKTPIKIGTKLRVAKFDPQDNPDHGPTIMEAGPARLAWYETDDIGDVINQLAAETPFDYRERHRWVGDEIHHFLDFAWPGFGRRRNDLRFVIGENIAVPPAISSGEYATEVLALGAGEGRTQRRVLVSRGEDALRRAVVVSDPSYRRETGLARFAQRELAARSGEDFIDQIVLQDHKHAPVGAVDLGDEIRIQGKAGWRDVDMWVRVVSISIRPDQADTQVLSVQRSDTIGL